MAKKIEETITDEEKKGVLFSISNGYLASPRGFNENEYYYHLIPAHGSYKLVPVQVVGGLVQELKKVDGKVGEPATSINNIYSIKHGLNIPAIKQLLLDQKIEYKEDSYLKYIETAKQYQLLREKLIYKILKSGENTLLYQGSKKLLPSTSSAFSLGYNEDSYIKSSIAYEIEMYMRSIFSKYGVLDQDLKDIFTSHNIKEAFLKFPRTVREEMFKKYKVELERKQDSLNKSLVEEILNPEKIETIVSFHEKSKSAPTEEVIEILIQYYENINRENILDDKQRRIKERILNLIKTYKSQHEKYDNDNFSNKSEDYINYSKEVYEKGNYKVRDTFDKRYNIYNDAKIDSYVKNVDTYRKYKKLDIEYSGLIEYLTRLNKEISIIQTNIKEIEREIRKQDNIYKSKGNYAISIDEYNSLKTNLKRLEIELNKFNILKNQIIKKIDTIEEEMANYIFDDELKMETAYQDNRYTYENMANNNYDNMLIFLNVLKSVVTQDKIQRIDYDQLYRNLTVSQKNSSKSSVVKTTEYEIRDFEQLFSRKDKRYSCAKRISKKGAISKFFKSKKDIKLDAIYSAELKYFGALSVKDNDNLFISECAIASELYLKSLLRSKETIHSLKDLYIKVDNKVKSMIVRKVNSYLKLDLTKKEFLAILSKNEISNAFSEYRYLYEKEADKEDVKFVEALTRALHSVSASKIKYKSPYYEAIEKEIREDSQKQK